VIREQAGPSWQISPQQPQPTLASRSPASRSATSGLPLLSERAQRRRGPPKGVFAAGALASIPPGGRAVIGFTRLTTAGTCCQVTGRRLPPQRPTLPQGYKEPFSLLWEAPPHRSRPDDRLLPRCPAHSMPGMPSSFLHPRALPSSLLRCSVNVDGHGTDLSVFLLCRRSARACAMAAVC